MDSGIKKSVARPASSPQDLDILSIPFGSARISQSSKPQLPSPPRVSIVAEQPRTFRDGFRYRSDLRDRAATKRKHRRRRRARHSSTQGAREIDGAVDSRCFPPQPFREADPSGAGFVPPRRDPRRDLPGGSFAGRESTGRGGGEVNPKRTRTPAEDAGRRDASERVDPGSHPGDPTKVPGRPQGASHDSDRAAERCPARFPSGTPIGGNSLNFQRSGRDFPRPMGCTPRLATTGSDVPRDPPTQVLVVVRDEARHAPIKKLLQEIGYKGARQT